MCIQDSLPKQKDILHKTDVIESCSRENVNTKWKFYKLTKITLFVALLKDVPMACKYAVFHEPLLENITIKCLNFNKNTRKPHKNNLCFFGSLALLLHGNQKLEEKTSSVFKFFMIRMDGLNLSQFLGINMNDTLNVEDLSLLNILLDAIDIVEANNIREVSRRSAQKNERTVRLLRNNNHIIYVSNINALFQFFVVPIVTVSLSEYPICGTI